MRNDVIALTDLRKTYSNGVTALKGINLEVEKGDFYALLGPNGAGKSTTIGILSSLVVKTSGRVSIFGYDIDKDEVSAKMQLGLVPQEFNFNPFEQVEQILINQAGFYGISRKQALIRAHEYLEKLGLYEKRKTVARLLSGGMKRRLLIARALMHDPNLLILDEPTAGVDIELRRQMWDFLRELNDERGKTIILTTHYLEEAEMLCRNIGIIQDGRLIENSSMRDLLMKMQFETIVLDIEPTNVVIHVTGYKLIQLDPSTLEIEIQRDQGMNDLFQQLSMQNINVISMRNKTNRLEELFVRMVSNAEKRGKS